MSVLSQQASHPCHLDDEIVALSLQLEEINYREETKKAKYTPDNVPDLEVAYASYLTEIEAHLAFLKDVKLAHSIANAVDADAEAIAELAQAESQAQEDRRVAVQMSSDDPDLEAPPPYAEVVRDDSIEEEVIHRMIALLSSEHDAHDDSENEAGPSVSYTQRQADAMGKLARNQFECIACRDEFRFADITQIGCDSHHQYCGSCLKQFIMNGVVNHDLAYLPPRCCGKEVSRATIVKSLTEQELEDFTNAEIEKQTQVKTYCSNSECGRFVAPCHIAAGEAICPRCSTKTCTTCNSPQHEGDCPADTGLQAVLDLGAENRWRRCFSCRSMVAIEWGCNHMTCRCGAEFCYQCGTEWTEPRQCRCDLWTERNLIRRAEQVVDRVAPPNLLPVERQRRVAAVQEQLRDTDECEHRGRKKFTQIYGGGRQGFRCEMCNARHWRFIMQCRRCQLELCMDCRLHRV